MRAGRYRAGGWGEWTGNHLLGPSTLSRAVHTARQYSRTSKLANDVWATVDQPRGPFEPNEYGDVIVPMTIPRRLDCILAHDP
ncbi:hypothetical protein FH969_05640 [Miniimonas arenae]|uniref:N6 adenine-specific DNA methyltransferase N-terminal domain-containing protein n=1 Tax=Miniimonas arenae TaxID=676201 RepID=A0A5C5BEG1_9MICO|nr:hypothetical protein FH969_05640 [Miniimonas arenae]